MRILVVLFAGFRAPFFCIPALRGSGAVVVISQKKPAREPAHIPPFPGVIPHTGPWWQSPGEGPGREPPPRRGEPCRPFPRAPAQERGQYRRDPWRGTSPGRRTRIPLSPLPHPHRKGAAVMISLERPAREPAHIPPFPGVIPHTGPWWQSPGEGPGREPPPRRKEPYRPSPGLPRRSGGYRGDGPGRA